MRLTTVACHSKNSPFTYPSLKKTVKKFMNEVIAHDIKKEGAVVDYLR
ncbi:MAG: hypothetical protein J5486_09085 [Bacteroidaceae bacterium]|nr:hypothetical protein [Bacteroidaceae bacterium]